VVANGVDGFLVPPADVEGLADALDRVSDPEVSRHMGTLGAERVERQFGWAVIGNRLESVYADVVRQHRAIRRESSGT
jgi:glycosyltransferase involved in cell wall biosynthesis